MTNLFRIVDLVIEHTREFEIRSNSPEAAALEALGVSLVRSGSQDALRAKVYWRVSADTPVNMIRLYSKAEPKR